MTTIRNIAYAGLTQGARKDKNTKPFKSTIQTVGDWINELGLSDGISLILAAFKKDVVPEENEEKGKEENEKKP